MSEIVRDPSRVFLCPRCGRPVTYKGRGRGPVWCSARCRVEASIERRGNRVVGVEPHVVTVIPPRQRLSEWERNQRQRIADTLTESTVAAMIADDPYLLLKILDRVQADVRSCPETQRRVITRRLTEAARAISPESPDLAGSVSLPVQHRGWKRSAMEWATLLDELAAQLGNGQFYSRDLPTIDEPLSRVAERYIRRRSE
jgi:hypothetical protein